MPKMSPSLPRCGGQALRNAYADLQANGTTSAAVPMYSFAEFNDLIGFPDVWEFERRYKE